jgi:hypothetical protein
MMWNKLRKVPYDTQLVLTDGVQEKVRSTAGARRFAESQTEQ